MSRRAAMRRQEAAKARQEQREQARYESSCANKRGMTEQQAKNEARRLSSETKANIVAYPCDFCDKWHVGNK